MKRKITALIMALFLGFGFMSCYGPFVLTKKLYRWNGSLGNKYVNSIVFWALLIVPVYGIVGFVDFAVLNTVEFWTGKNPLAMKEGESETKYVKKDNKTYKMTATKDRMDIVVSDEQGVKLRELAIVFDRETNQWFKEENGERKVIAKIDPDNQSIDYL